MGLLDQLWDDTLAGPRPENGLGKLRKYNTFSFRAVAGKEIVDSGRARSFGDDAVADDSVKVTRSIMIVKPPGYNCDSPPVSPAGTSTPPVSPFSGSREQYRFRRRSLDAFDKASSAGPRSPSSPYDV